MVTLALLALVLAPPAAGAKAKAKAGGGYPSKISSFTAQPGPKPGEITLKWQLEGDISERLVVETSLSSFSPFNNAAPRKGWNWQRFAVSGQTRKVVLTAAQVAQAGAPLGSGRQLLIRTYNQSTHKNARVKRWFGPVQAAAPQGSAPAGSGSRITVASYNVRMQGLDNGNLAWEKRVPRVAAGLAARRPWVVGLNEFLPRMHADLMSELAKDRNGMRSYALTRTTPVTSSSPTGARILYDTQRLKLVSDCPADRVSCVVPYATTDGRITYAPYARFKVKATGENFWFVAAHLTSGQGEAAENLRYEQARKVIDAMTSVNRDRLPVIFTGDINSAQAAGFKYRPHTALFSAGYYDASAAVTRTGLEYDTVNHLKQPRQEKNKRGFGARLDVIMTKGMSGATRFDNVVVQDPNEYPSDHNLVVAELQLP